MEEDFFLKKMKGVKPLKKRDNKIDKTKSVKKNKKKNTVLKKTKRTKLTEVHSQLEKKTKSNFNLTFSEINKDLKKGRVNIDRRIDLHGYTLLDAQDKIKKEIIKNYENKKRCLLVITGKGLYQANKNDQFYEHHQPKLFHGKIKNSIIGWIKEDDIKKYVLTYQDAGFEHGGDGAIFIYLRKKRN